MANRKTDGPDGLPAGFLQALAYEGGPDTLENLYDINVAVGTGEGVPQQLKGATIMVLRNYKDRTKFGKYRSIFLLAHAGKVPLKVIAGRPSDCCEREGALPKGQCGFGRQRSTGNGKEENPAVHVFTDLSTANDPVARTCRWPALARFSVEPGMLAVIHQFHDGVRACRWRVVSARICWAWSRVFGKGACSRHCCSTCFSWRCCAWPRNFSSLMQPSWWCNSNEGRRRGGDAGQ